MLSAIFVSLLLGDPIEIRARGPDGAVERRGVVDGRLDPLEETTRFDLQLGERRRFRGLELETIVSHHARAGDGDLVVLRFANGMRVPVLRADLARVRALVAFEIEAGGSFVRDFPPVAKKRLVSPDPRPIRFGANKVVVSDPWAPRLSEHTLATFSPWAFVDSLIAIDIFDAREWEREFPEALAPFEMRGREVFLERCQWCHGIGQRGASFGWDFLTPLPLSELRSPRSLYAHVRYRNLDAGERGYLMPAQDAEPEEIESLWRWIANVAARRDRVDLEAPAD
jgi:hypothetical protein